MHAQRMPKLCNNQAFGELNNMGFYFKLGVGGERKWILPILHKTGCIDPEESSGVFHSPLCLCNACIVDVNAHGFF